MIPPLLAIELDTPMIVAFLGILIAPVLGYLAASRKMSGKIGTSEATDLWAESKAIREDYRESHNQDALRTADLEKRVAQLEKDNNALSRENIDLTRKVVAYETNITGLTSTIEGLQTTIVDMSARIKVLEDQNSELQILVNKLQDELVESKKKEA